MLAPGLDPAFAELWYLADLVRMSDGRLALSLLRTVDLNTVGLAAGTPITSITLLPTPTSYAWYDDVTPSLAAPISQS